MSATDSPDWALVLEALYDKQRPKIRLGAPIRRDNIKVSGKDPLFQELDIGMDEMNDALGYMHYSGLLDGIQEELLLTPKGFDVAHERKLQEWSQQREENRIEHQEEREDQRAEGRHKVNTAIAILTIGLVTVTVLDSAVRAFVGAGDSGAAFVVVGVGFAALLAYVFVIGRYGLIPENFDS